MRTRRWTRSPRGEIFGVVTGLAEWRELNPSMTRFIVFLIILFTGIFPGIVIYLVLALILPMQTEDDIISDIRPHRKGKTIDVSYEEAGDDDKINKEYEDLRQAYKKEKDWDERFNKGE